MAERPSSSANSDPQQLPTTTRATTPLVQQQQQPRPRIRFIFKYSKEQRQGLQQQQLQQRVTSVGHQQQQQQVLADLSQQQILRTVSVPSANQIRSDPQGTTGAGTPYNRKIAELQNMKVSQIVDQAQLQDLGHTLQSILRASRKTHPLTIQQQRQLLFKTLEVQQQQASLAQQQPTKQRLEMPKQQGRAQQAHGQQMQQNAGNTMLARASSTGAQMQGLATQQPQQQAQPEMVPTSLATNNRGRPGTAGAAAEPQNSLPSSAPVAIVAPTEPLDEPRSILSRCLCKTCRRRLLLQRR